MDPRLLKERMVTVLYSPAMYSRCSALLLVMGTVVYSDLCFAGISASVSELDIPGTAEPHVLALALLSLPND